MSEGRSWRPIPSAANRRDLHRAVGPPGSRYWTFQGIESAIFFALAVGLVGLSLWWLRDRIA
jgi:hypothetical protein